MVFDLFNGGTTYNVPNLDVTEVSPNSRYFIQTLGHNDLGFGTAVGISWHVDGTPEDSYIDVWALPGHSVLGGASAVINNDPDTLGDPNHNILGQLQPTTVNIGSPIIKLPQALGYPLFYISYADESGSTAAVFQTCTFGGFRLTPPGDCGVGGLFDQLFIIDPIHGTPPFSVAKLFHDPNTGVQYLDPASSRDGSMVAFTSNYGTSGLYVMIVKLR